jgi:hypothetical protein
MFAQARAGNNPPNANILCCPFFTFYCLVREGFTGSREGVVRVGFLFYMVGLLSLGIGGWAIEGRGACLPKSTRALDTSEFIESFESLLDSAARFDVLAAHASIRLGRERNPFLAIPRGRVVLADRLIDGAGRGELVQGTLINVEGDDLLIQSGPNVRRVYAQPGIGGLTNLAVFPASSEKVPFELSFSSLLDSAVRFRELSDGGVVLRRSGDFFKLIPLGSEVLIDILVDGHGRARLVRGRLVQVNDHSLVVSVKGDFINIFSEPGIGGLTSLAVLSSPPQ